MMNHTAPAPGTVIEPTDPRVEHADPITHELTVRRAAPRVDPAPFLAKINYNAR